jgi:hypothetical protein
MEPFVVSSKLSQILFKLSKFQLCSNTKLSKLSPILFKLSTPTQR